MNKDWVVTVRVVLGLGPAPEPTTPEGEEGATTDEAAAAN